MIFGIGIDIVKVSRLERWVKDESLIRRFFNDAEQFPGKSGTVTRMCEFYAARFAAKEAFSKALGTGLQGFDLKDVYIRKDDSEKPSLVVTGKALMLLNRLCGEHCEIHVSLSHEKEYAVAFVVIECR